MIFGTHLCTDEKIKELQQFFISSKIIRIVITQEERELVNILSDKILNGDVVEEIKESRRSTKHLAHKEIQPTVYNANIIDFKFSSLFNEEEFDNEYSKIIKFLDLPYKLVRYDFIKYWISKHPKEVREIFNENK